MSCGCAVYRYQGTVRNLDIIQVVTYRDAENSLSVQVDPDGPRAAAPEKKPLTCHTA